jgi:hypothetical protein
VLFLRGADRSKLDPCRLTLEAEQGNCRLGSATLLALRSALSSLQSCSHFWLPRTFKKGESREIKQRSVGI